MDGLDRSEETQQKSSGFCRSSSTLAAVGLHLGMQEVSK